jgi:hypothetical protein
MLDLEKRRKEIRVEMGLLIDPGIPLSASTSHIFAIDIEFSFPHLYNPPPCQFKD